MLNGPQLERRVETAPQATQRVQLAPGWIWLVGWLAGERTCRDWSISRSQRQAEINKLSCLQSRDMLLTVMGLVIDISSF